MTEAIHAHIDAFALNIANDESTTESSWEMLSLRPKTLGSNCSFHLTTRGMVLGTKQK